jgi:hypothetical protein
MCSCGKIFTCAECYAIYKIFENGYLSALSDMKHDINSLYTERGVVGSVVSLREVNNRIEYRKKSFRKNFERKQRRAEEDAATLKRFNTQGS